MPVYELNGKQYNIPEDRILDFLTAKPLARLVVHSIHSLFEEQVNKTPQNIAVVYGNTKLTYQELNSRANQLANFLVAKYKIKPEDLVALCLDRSEHMLIAMLAVLKSGAAYVPMDPNVPDERISFMLSDTSPKVLLTNSGYNDRLEQLKGKSSLEIEVIENDSFLKFLETNYSSENTDRGIQSHHLAYIIYTSGTTGNPKGVMIEHGNAGNVIAIFRQYLQNIPDKNTIQYTNFLWYANYVFDAHVYEVYPPLIDGHSIYIVDGEERLDLLRLKEYIVDNQIEVACVPPILLDKDYLLPVKVLTLVGEVTNQEIVDSYVKNDVKVVNGYGPTETTVCSNLYLFSKNDKNTILGKALPSYREYILDENRQPLPQGAIGELYIGGPGVGRGYLNNAELTSERFLPNPFQTESEKSNHLNARIYKTGDLAKCLPNGCLEYMGRNDFQVKIRGFRIELGEIETRLSSHTDVKQVVVLAREHISGMKYLVAYYTSTEALDSDVLRKHVSNYVPDYMVPSVFVHMPKMPMTISGKLDRLALPNPEFTGEQDYVAPQCEMEELLCSIYGDVLKIDVEAISVEDDFFRLGGNSILAIKLVNKINDVLKKDIRISVIFSYTTVSELADYLKNNQDEAVRITVKNIDKPEEQILSFAQERLWFIESYEGGSNAYNIPMIFKIRDNVNVDSLILALNSVAQRHHILRTLIRVSDQGENYQKVIDFTHLKIDNVHVNSISELDICLFKAVNYVFRLDNEFPIRIHLYTLGISKYMSIVIHHIAFDGWSGDILIKEILNYYHYHESIRYNKHEESLEYLLPDLSLQYKDFALWQREYLAGDMLQKQLDFWRQQLDGYESLNLPTDKPRPSRIDYAGADIFFKLDEDISAGLRNVAKELGVSLYSVLLSGYYLLLSVYSNQKDIVVGSPIANRNYRELADIIGFFVNTLALRKQIDNDESVTEFIRQVGKLATEAQDYQDLPFEKLVNELNVKQDTSRHPIFQVAFGVQSFGNDQHDEVNELLDIYSLGGASAYSVAKFDLTTIFDDSQNSIAGSINYATSLFKEETICHLILTYKKILAQFSALDLNSNKEIYLKDLSYLDQGQFQKMMYDWNIRKSKEIQFPTIQSLFEEQVSKYPDNIAVVIENKRITYTELNERANRLASFLVEKYKIQPDDLIGLCLERSEFIPIAILAVLKSGGAYVPMDPLAPTERLTHMIADTATKVVLTTAAHQHKLEEIAQRLIVGIQSLDNSSFIASLNENYSGKNLHLSSQTNSLAYVIYTSGTTGSPKGVMVEHMNVMHLFKSTEHLYHFSDKHVWTLFHSYTFDFSVWELWGALLYGGKLVVPSYEQTRNTELFYNLCIEEGVSILNQTPTAFYQFINVAILQNKKIDSLKYVIFGGEALNTAQLKPWYEIYDEAAPYLVNMYGITETTVFATYPAALKASQLDDIPLIGLPIDGYTAYVLDKDKRPLPVGAIGELYLGGVGVTRGYLNNHDLTAQRFVTNPFQTKEEQERGYNATIYKSGDLVRYLPDGNLEYIGRNDFQVKIRGFRIELGEIEARLSSYTNIKQSVVLVKEHSSDIKYLVAYYVCDEALNANDIRSYLGKYLSEYMIPTFFIHLTELPLTLNGKLDRRALPETDITENRVYVAPRNSNEEKLCRIFAETLNLDAKKISVDDDYFELGGNSIVATKLIHKINEAFGSKVKIVDLFMARTIQNIALIVTQSNYKTLVELNKSQSKDVLFMVHSGGGGCEAYLSLAQHLEPFFSCCGIDSYNLYNDEKIEDLHVLASYYVDNMPPLEVNDSCTLLGWSLGGLIALEIAAILESKGLKNIKVYLLDTIINDKDRSIQVAAPTDDMIEEIVKRYDGIEFQSAKELLLVENKLTNQSISRPLNYTNVVLFKAMLSNPDWNKSNFYNMHNVLANRDLLEVIEMPQSTHDNIIQEELTIVRNIIKDSLWTIGVENQSNTTLSSHTLGKPLLITIPFAGGNSYSYKDMFQSLEELYDIHSLEIPGRGFLTDLPLKDDLNDIADFLFNMSILPLNLKKGYVIYGHSMGALLTYLVLHKIKQHRLPLPNHVVVSGRMGPSIKKEKQTHKLPSADFWAMLQNMGGIPETVLHEEELREYFEPIIRADFKAVETYSHIPVDPINVPITVLYGDKEQMTLESIHTWQKETTQPVQFIKMTGNHFFIYDHAFDIRAYFKEVHKLFSK